MNVGRILGLDIGLKRTGVAMSDELQLVASPLLVMETQNEKVLAENIRKIIEENSVVRLVVGMPLNQFGEKGRDAKIIDKFISIIKSIIDIPVIEWDERFSTHQAERVMIQADVSRKKRKEKIDKIAAAIILQSYLDSQKFSQKE